MTHESAVQTEPTITVSVKLFGAFRQFGPETAVELTVPASARVADLRAAFAGHYQGNDNALALLKASAFATDQAVLDDDDELPTNQPLSVLPPVCGG
jgi:sulfur-carrier protein